jgi:hypothetical protein
MMGIAGLAPANEAWLFGHKPQVGLVPQAPRHGDRQHAFVYARADLLVGCHLSPFGRRQDLAREAEVGVVTIRQLEAGVIQPRRATLVVVRRTLEAAGVEFIDDNAGGVGVRFRETRRERPRE